MGTLTITLYPSRAARDAGLGTTGSAQVLVDGEHIMVWIAPQDIPSLHTLLGNIESETVEAIATVSGAGCGPDGSQTASMVWW